MVKAQMVTAARVGDEPNAEPRDLSFLQSGSCFHPLPDANEADVVGWYIRDGAWIIGPFGSKEGARRYIKIVQDAGATRIVGGASDPGALILDCESGEFEPVNGRNIPHDADLYR